MEIKRSQVHFFVRPQKGIQIYFLSWKTMELTKNFTLEEMLESETAREHNITKQFDPPVGVIDNLKDLCSNLLQPLRDALGPLHISSGWRCNKLNLLVGGVPDSQHRTGQAADVEYYGQGGNQAIIDKVIELDLSYDQMINEHQKAWIHLSFLNKLKNRRQFLKIT